MSIKHLAASASADEIAAALTEDGAAIVDALAPASLMDQAAKEMQPYIAATRIGRDDFAGRHTRRTGGLIARSETCRDLVMNPLVLSVAKKMLAHAATFQIHLTQVITIEPERRPSQFIATNGYSIFSNSRRASRFNSTRSGR